MTVPTWARYPLLGLCFGLIGMLYVQVEQLREYARWKVHTYEVIRRLDTATAASYEVEGPRDGSGHVRARLDMALAEFAARTRDNPAQQARVGPLLEAAADHDGSPPAGDALRRLIREAEAEEDRLLLVRHAALARRLDTVRLLTLGMFGVGALIDTVERLTRPPGGR